MSLIDLASYTDLDKYGILAAGTLTTVAASGIPIAVNQGDWYGSIVTSTPAVGGLVAGPGSNGLNTLDSAGALSDLNTLITDIGTITSGLTNVPIGAGTIFTFQPGFDYTGAGITYATANITFDGLNNVNPQFFITDLGSGFTFTDTTFVFINGALPCNIFWLADNGATGAFSSTRSSVPGIIITSAGFTAVNSNPGVPVSGPAMNLIGHIFSKGAASFTSGGGPLSLTIDTATCPIVCYAKGTLILTKQGYIPIENIKAGHKVVTKGRIYENKFVNKNAPLKVEPVMWISKFNVVNLNSKSRPICIKKDALGKNYPFKDLFVSPGHRLLLNGEMVLAKNLVNETTIYQDTECDQVEYYHLECENHSAIIANNVLSESYLEFGNTRNIFENSIKLRRKNSIKLKPKNVIKLNAINALR